jgi:PAS domain S-box-containing protein
VPTKERPFIPLRLRLSAIICLLLIALLGTLALALGILQGRTIRSQVESRGLAIARSVAATSLSDLMTYNYVALEQSANQAAQDPDILYVAIHDKEGRLAGLSGRSDLQSTFLRDRHTLSVLQSDGPVMSEIEEAVTGPALEIGFPVFRQQEGQRWGTVRVGMSLTLMQAQIRQTQMTILIIGLMAMFVGIAVAILTARRVTTPLGRLVQATVEAANGKLDQDLSVSTRDELEILASNFSHMARVILGHQKELERQLDEITALQRYRENLLRTMADGLLSMDLSGRVVSMNPAAVSILGLSEGREHQGGTIDSILEGNRQLLPIFTSALNNPGRLASREASFLRNGESATILIGASVLEDGSGQPEEIILTLHDVTALKLLEARVRQAERLAALGTLSAGLAHEIRNPLSAIKTFVQLLPRKVAKEGFLEKFQRTVPREVNRIDGLVESLLELSKVPKYHYEPTDLEALLRSSIQFMEESLREAGVECSLSIEEELPPVWADPKQLVKAVHNLILNGAQAMPGGGKLEIAAGQSERSHHLPPRGDAWVLVSFRDHGPGIPESLLKDIFNPFFTTKDKGTGLGLAITHKVVSEHGGAIEAGNAADGGACFTVHLPAMPGQKRLTVDGTVRAPVLVPS